MKPEFQTIPISAYLSDPAPVPSLTRSLIVTLLGESPYHAWWGHPRLNPDRPQEEANKAMDIGSAAHAMLLEGREAFMVINPAEHRSKPTKDNPDGSIPDGWTNKAMREARDSAKSIGKYPLLPKDHQGVLQMVEVAQRKLSKVGIDLTKGRAEQTVIWHSGCWLRTRSDWISADGLTVFEYKTTASAPAEWKRNLYAKGYDIQEAMHRSGVAAVTGEVPRVIFAVQNTEPPYSMFFVELSTLYREIAHRKISRAADMWQKCLDAGVWPDYGNEPEVIDPAAWQIAVEEERELAHEGWTPEAFLFGKVKE